MENRFAIMDDRGIIEGNFESFEAALYYLENEFEIDDSIKIFGDIKIIEIHYIYR